MSLDSAGRSLFGDDTKPYSSNLEGFYRNKYHLQDIFGISGGINLTFHFPSRNQICTEKLVSNERVTSQCQCWACITCLRGRIGNTKMDKLTRTLLSPVKGWDGECESPGG